MSYENLCDIVKEVNREKVAAEEVLGDHAYYYSRKHEQLFMEEC